MLVKLSASGRSRVLRGLIVGAFLLGIAVSASHAQDKKPLSLSACLELGLSNQPALAAARASLAAAESSQRGLNDIVFGALLARDLPIRKQQACLGVTIAAAGLQQAEWETRYAVTRNYFSVIYARQQENLVKGVVERLEEARQRAIKLKDIGDPQIKVTQIDVDVLTLNVELVRTKQTEASVGVQRALAALREAIGIGPDYPLDVVDTKLPAIVNNLNKQELISQGLAMRAELVQASAGQQVTQLEISAQGKTLFKPQARTFAMGSDIHAQPVPQGHSNGEYRPGAIGLEMPPTMAGPRRDRMAHASDLNDRAIAVVSKAQNLVALEVEATYLKWDEAKQKLNSLERAPAMAADIGKKVQDRFNEGNATAEDYLRTRTMEDQVQAQYNEAMYMHALALAALERVTAGGYRIASK